MTTPADDCGVTGGCQACPLFAANVCGDPGPGLPDHAPRLAEQAAQPRAFRRAEPDWGALVDAYLTRELARLLYPARFSVAGDGTATDRHAPPALVCRNHGDPWQCPSAPLAYGCGPVPEGQQWPDPCGVCAGRGCPDCPANDLTAVAEAAGVLVDPDAPDVDPAEPTPEGAGCCGGGCGG
ncbi:hypothetical protein GA0070616_4582 [Micromonospora nigra]|uniref:Uncharacterized protein n=1 Tax=Micromonospora nigra TaxID=145857 RepID=A0A1C6STC4_9ACTN|nr:hypothetical protein [Micromonospora nigra]SCL32894.1 hypothetical protein GA0070616_4582 [Micromonospora nigra]